MVCTSNLPIRISFLRDLAARSSLRDNLVCVVVRALALTVVFLTTAATSAAAPAFPASVISAKHGSVDDQIELVQYRDRRRGGRRRGGGGVGIGIGIGALIIQEGLRDDRERRRRYRPPKRASITCRNGRVRGGRCVCRQGATLRRTGRNSYACKPQIAEPKPDIICPARAARRRAMCFPSGRTAKRLGRRIFSCIRIANPTEPKRPSVRVGDKVVPPVIMPPPPTQPPGRVTTPRRATSQPPIVPAFLPPVRAGEIVPEFVPEEVLITVPNSAPQTLKSEIATTHGLTVLERSEFGLIDERVIRMRVKPTDNVPATVQRLRSDPRIIAAQPNYLYQGPQATKPTSSSPLQYALAKLDTANAQTFADGRGIVVAVIDSGVDVAHPDLSGVVAKQFNAIGDTDVTPDSHGTAIAGIIGGRGLVRGVAPGANVLDVRAFKPSTSDGPRLATTFILARAMQWAIEQDARIFNLSFTGPRDPQLLKIIKAASADRAIMIAAAGNGGSGAAPAYPAAYDEVIAVTATDPSEKLYEKANHGRYIALAAPGVDIFAPIPGKSHTMHSGTSFAAAHVSGILALMLQRNPSLSAAEALSILISGAKDLGAPGHDELFGAGEANAYNSLRNMTRDTTVKP